MIYYFNRSYIDILVAMTEKEVKVRYKNAVFGFLWMFFIPFFQMLIIALIFNFIFKFDKYYLPSLLLGLLSWNFFAQTVTQTTNVFIKDRNIVHKANFPREIMILSIILANIYSLFISLLILLLIFLFMGFMTWWGFVGLFLNLLMLFLLTLGISLITSSLNARYRDVQYIVQATLLLWFYATPIIYELKMIPNWLRFCLYLNPMTGVVEGLKWSMLNTTPVNNLAIIAGYIIIIGIFKLGILIFRRSSFYLADWV